MPLLTSTNWKMCYYKTL